MKTLLLKQRYFLIPYFVFLLASAVFMAFSNRADGHLILNKFQITSLNNFFSIITHLGDGLMLALVAVVFLFIRFKDAFFLGLAGAMGGGITQFLKSQFFDSVDRPYQYFKFYDPERRSLQLVLDASEMHIHHSFPSGHATTAFSLMLGLSIIADKPNKSLWLVLFALILAYSRVYLSQHFLQDIAAGSLVAVFSTLLVAYGFKKIRQPEWFNKSLLHWKNS